MDPFTPVRVGVSVATHAVKLATAVPKAIAEHALHRGNGDGGDGDRFAPTDSAATASPASDSPSSDSVEAARDVATTPAPAPEPSGPAPGGTGRRTPSPKATRRRAATTSPDVESAKAPAEPTSAAGASAGVAGTLDAPGDAAVAGAPDPTAASTVSPRPVAPQGERKPTDVTATPISQVKTVDDEPVLAETEGAAAPGPQIHVDEPWPNYAKMKAPDVVDRLRTADDATKAVVRLYEQTNKNRKSIITATEG